MTAPTECPHGRSWIPCELCAANADSDAWYASYRDLLNHACLCRWTTIAVDGIPPHVECEYHAKMRERIAALSEELRKANLRVKNLRESVKEARDAD